MTNLYGLSQNGNLIKVGRGKGRDNYGIKKDLRLLGVPNGEKPTIHRDTCRRIMEAIMGLNDLG